MGLLATGTSCFAEVWVMGRSRVPGAATEDEPSHAAPLAGRAGLDRFVVFELVVALGGDEIENVVLVDGPCP